MLKKISWVIAALFVASAMIFIGCPTELGKQDDGTAPKKAEDLVLEGEDIILKACGASSSKVVIDGNKVTLDANNTGFYFDFPEAAAEYAQVQVFFEIIEVMAGTGPGLLIKRNTQFQNPIGITSDQDPAYQLNNVGPAGTKFDTGLWNTNRFDNQMAFQNQIYNPAGNDASKFTVEVLKIVFPGGGEPPAELLPPEYKGAAGKVAYATAGDDKVVVDSDPSFVAVFGADVSATGVITMKEGAILHYKFPASALDGTTAKDVDLEKDYDYVDIEYRITDVVKGKKADGTDSDGNFKARVYKYNTTNDYVYAGGSWANFGLAKTDVESTTTVDESLATYRLRTWGAGGTGGFSIGFNQYDINADGAESLKFKITKVTFTKVTRYKIDFFSPLTPSLNSIDPVTVPAGSTLAGDYPSLAGKNPGWVFLGWFDDWDITTDFDVPATATEVTASTVYGTGATETEAVRLFAKWLKYQLPNKATPALSPASGTLFVAVDSYAAGGADMTTVSITSATDMGTGTSTAAATFAYPATGATSKSYWIVASAHGGFGSNYSWDNPIGDFAAGKPNAAVFTAIIAAQAYYGNANPGYTRLGYNLANLSSDWQKYTKVTLTYDVIRVGGTNTNIQLRNSATAGSGSDVSAIEVTSDGTDRTATLNIADFNTGWIGMVKSGAGAVLLRITKVELHY